ncbi:Zinc finger protein 714 [Plecturocebus cupreus]
MVAHAYNLSTLGGQGRRIMRSDQDHPGQHDETPSLLKIQKLARHGGACLLGNRARLRLKKKKRRKEKKRKISQVRWHTPVVPVTREAEAGESLEPGRQRLHGIQTSLQFRVPNQSHQDTTEGSANPGTASGI